MKPAVERKENSKSLTILLPCLNESETIDICIAKAKKSLLDLSLDGEVLVADNGSNDGSQSLAIAAGARVINVAERGYGSALRTGILHVDTHFVIMGDADDSYALDDLGLFLDRLDAGFDLVMGNRFQGGIAPGAMPWLHRYLGNPVLSKLGRLFFRAPIGDFHCGLRGFRTDSIRSLNLKSNGMEFASEMIVKASLYGLKITEVPTTLTPDGRSRAPHLRTWRDGWRHLIFLFSSSPRWFFIYPGIILSLFGTAIVTSPLLGSNYFNSSFFSSLLGLTLINVGFLAIFLGLIARVFSTNLGTIPANSNSKFISRFFTFQNGILMGSFAAILGTSNLIAASAAGWDGSISENNPIVPTTILLSFSLICVGFQLVFTSFLASLMQALSPNTSDEQ